MNAKTLEALDESIAHWKRNVVARNHSKTSASSDECALCSMFNDRDEEALDCLGCPIYKTTHLKYCFGTPYEDALSAWREWGRLPDGDGEACKAARLKWKEAAQAELNFLKSLRPIGI